MCVFIENKIKKIAKVAVGLQLSNGYLLPKAQSISLFAFTKAQKKQACPKNDVVLGATT